MTKAKQDEPATVTVLPESKRQKFNRLAIHRMKTALKRVELIKNLADRGSYEYTDDEAAQLVRRLHAAADDVEATFRSAARKQVDFNFEGR